MTLRDINTTRTDKRRAVTVDSCFALIGPLHLSFTNTVEPRYNDLQYNKNCAKIASRQETHREETCRKLPSRRVSAEFRARACVFHPPHYRLRQN